ncbi:MAG: hypothetical protein IT292_11185 [Deltaproteobacteria bacterium]|nr:hypothetical protein [Deltaproteobacteria bacterium]
MADKSKKQAKGSWGGRLLIMLFGFCIVAIGAQPIQKEYGSFVNFLRAQSKAFAKESKGGKSEKHDKGNNILKSFTLPSVTVKTQDEAKVVTAEKSKQLDHIDAVDRKGLDNLINGM